MRPIERIPENLVYCFWPAYQAPLDGPQQIVIRFRETPGVITTSLICANIDLAVLECQALNYRLRLQPTDPFWIALSSINEDRKLDNLPVLTAAEVLGQPEPEAQAEPDPF